MRKDSALANLTEEQQADLFDWLTTDTYDVVLKRIAQPPPKGFGIKTHMNSLYRFYEQRQAQIRIMDLNRLASSTPREGEAPDEPLTHNSDLANHNCEAVLSTQRFFNASQMAFAHSTYILANSPPNPTNYRAVSRALHQHADAALKHEYLDIARQQLALARERLQLDRTQFEYNAARAALALLPELVAIDQMPGIDDEAKIWRVRDRLFGATSSPKTSPAQCSMLDAQSVGAFGASSSTTPPDQCSMLDGQCPDREGEAPNEPHSILK